MINAKHHTLRYKSGIGGLALKMQIISDKGVLFKIRCLSNLRQKTPQNQVYAKQRGGIYNFEPLLLWFTVISLDN